jgi:hypothetical protein
MVSGFTNVTRHGRAEHADPSPAVRLALWETPGGGEKKCTPIRTDTFCTGVVLWCKDVYFCSYQGRSYEESRTPYPCGVCVGVSTPSDW